MKNCFRRTTDEYPCRIFCKSYPLKYCNTVIGIKSFVERRARGHSPINLPMSYIYIYIYNMSPVTNARNRVVLNTVDGNRREKTIKYNTKLKNPSVGFDSRPIRVIDKNARCLPVGSSSV